MKQIQSVLLDIDGTLIDSNEQHALAWYEYLTGQGLKVPLGRLRLMIGMGGDRILRELYRNRLDAKRMKAMAEERDALFLKRYAPRIRPMPGAVEFVAAMVSRGMRVALATSARGEMLESIFRTVPVQSFIVGYTTSSEVERSKPAPDIFLTAIRRFGFEPARTVVVGDTPYDIEAARAVPCRCVAVQSGHFPYFMLSGADELWRDVQQLTSGMSRSILAA